MNSNSDIFADIIYEGLFAYSIAKMLGYNKDFKDLYVINMCSRSFKNLIPIDFETAQKSKKFINNNRLIVNIEDVSILYRLSRFFLINKNVLYIDINKEDIVKMWKLCGYQTTWTYDNKYIDYYEHFENKEELLLYNVSDETLQIFKGGQNELSNNII